MEVIEDTNKKLCLASQPSLLSQAAFFGFFAFGFALSFYSESIFWQLLYILGSFIIASSFLGQWQKLVIDKTSNMLHYNVQNIFQKLFATDKYLISENLNLEDMKQVKCNLSNGTISFYHTLTTISIFVGTTNRCEMMLTKFKSLLPNSTTSQHGEQLVKSLNILEETSKKVGPGNEPHVAMTADEQKHEAGDMPKTSSFDILRDDDDGMSSDDSFVKFDDKEFDDAAQDPSKAEFDEEQQEDEETVEPEK